MASSIGHTFAVNKAASSAEVTKVRKQRISPRGGSSRAHSPNKQMEEAKVTLREMYLCYEKHLLSLFTQIAACMNPSQKYECLENYITHTTVPDESKKYHEKILKVLKNVQGRLNEQPTQFITHPVKNLSPVEQLPNKALFTILEYLMAPSEIEEENFIQENLEIHSSNSVDFNQRIGGFSQVCKSFYQTAQTFRAVQMYRNAESPFFNLMESVNPAIACKPMQIEWHPEDSASITVINMAGIPQLLNDSLEQVALACPKLEAITLGAEVSNREITILAKYCPRLKSIASQGTSKITDEALLEIALLLPQIEKLSFLHMKEGAVSNFGLSALLHVCKNLTELTFKKEGLDSTGYMSLDPFSSLKDSLALERLSLTTALIDDANLDSITKFCPNLRMFELTSKKDITPLSNKVTAEGLKKLFIECKQMTHLRLGKFSELSAESLPDIASLAPEMRGMDLSGLAFDHAPEKLRNILDKWPCLNELFLENCSNLPNPVTPILLSYPNLRRVSTDRSHIPATDVATLEKNFEVAERGVFPA